jgi:hypothetical protein
MTELSHEEIKAEAIELPGSRTKNGLPHTIPLTSMMRRVLEALPRTGKFVINGTDRLFGDHTGSEGKSRTCTSTLDASRSTPQFASELQRLGVAPHIVELALNHRSGTFSGVAGICRATLQIRVAP